MGNSESAPWRQIGFLPSPEKWTVQVEVQLRFDCKNGPEDAHSLGYNKVKILMLGPTQNGKSSLVNSFFSALKRRINQYVLAASSDRSVTRTLVSPNVRVDGQELKFKLTDMPGIFACQSEHINNYVDAVLNGHIKEDEEVPQDAGLDEEAHYYIRNPGPFDRPCCVVLVMRAGKPLAEDVKERFQVVIQKAEKLKLKVAVVLTHVDNLADQQALSGRNVSRIFHDQRVHEAVRQASIETGIPISFIHPVVNYSKEVETVTEMNILHLYVLGKILDLAGEGANARSP